MPRLPVEFHPAAAEDAEAAARWYHERSPQAATAYLAEVTRAVRQVSEAPEQWPPYIEDTRRYIFRRFPFFLIYRVASNRIQVIAIAHAHRRPGFWRTR